MNDPSQRKIFCLLSRLLVDLAPCAGQDVLSRFDVPAKAIEFPRPRLLMRVAAQEQHVIIVDKKTQCAGNDTVASARRVLISPSHTTESFSMSMTQRANLYSNIESMSDKNSDMLFDALLYTD